MFSFPCLWPGGFLLPPRWLGVEASGTKENHQVAWDLEIISPFNRGSLSASCGLDPVRGTEDPGVDEAWSQ